MVQVGSGQLIIRSTGLRRAIHETLDESDSLQFLSTRKAPAAQSTSHTNLSRPKTTVKIIMLQD